nr:hypothetical protein [uncultured Methanoregula sp.]
MNSKPVAIFGLSFLMAWLATGCGAPPLTNPTQAVGEYAFKYKSGEIEVLQLFGDLTYKQEFYQDFATYQGHATPVYTNSGVWTNNGNNLKFKNLMGFCELFNPNRRINPPIEYGPCEKSWMGPKEGQPIVWFVPG